MAKTMEVEKVLEPGETILWSARPDPWFYARPTFMIYIVAVPFTVFTFFWLDAVTGGFHWPGKVVQPWTQTIPWVAIISGLLIFIAGVWMLSAPFWIWRQGKRTLQVLTNQRALVWDARRPKNLQSVFLEGKVDFRILDPEAQISDMDVVVSSGKGVLFRAVREPQNVIQQISKTAG